MLARSARHPGLLPWKTSECDSAVAWLKLVFGERRSSMRIIDNSSWVQAIQTGVTAFHAAHAGRGWFDSHDLVNWLNIHHNAVLNAIVTNYRITKQGKRAKDPVHTATREIGKFIERELGQIKIGDHESTRRITLTGGSRRDGVCVNSVWRINGATTSSAQQGVQTAATLAGLDLDDLDCLDLE